MGTSVKHWSYLRLGIYLKRLLGLDGIECTMFSESDPLQCLPSDGLSEHNLLQKIGSHLLALKD